MKNIAQIHVNHFVLKWARESLGLNSSKACESIGIGAHRLDVLEKGEKEPTLDELKAMSKAYKRTIATLLLNAPPKEKPLPPDRRTVNSKDLDKFHEKTILAVRKARALAQSLIELNREAGFKISRFQYKALMENKAANVAKHFRKELRLDELREIKNINPALEGYIEKIESLGIAVFQLSLTQDKLRGFSIVDEVLPIIVIKRGGEPPTAKIFSLFHEFGHIILNEGGLCDLSENTKQEIEMWCNAFAAELLIPSSELMQTEIVSGYKSNGKVWSKADLINLGNYFHVGPLAILRSLLDNDLTTSKYYQEKHDKWNKPSFGKAKVPEGRNIPKEIIKEKGRNYLTLAFNAFDQNRIDLKDLSDFLGVKFSYIPRTRKLLNV